MKRPAFQFYPADWRKDAALQSCSIGARGLWVEMLCIMHECAPYGYLCVNGQPMTDNQLARLVGDTVKAVVSYKKELEAAGVYSYDDGRIYSRRMVKDEHLRNVRAQAGSLGGNPALLAGKDKQKVNQTDNHSVKQSPTPSSSSSSSSSPTGKVKTSAQGAFPRPNEIPERVWNDFLTMRKAKRAPMTETALDGIRSEAGKAGLSLTQAIEMCCKRGWQGFEAGWLNKNDQQQFGKTSQGIALLEQMKG